MPEAARICSKPEFTKDCLIFSGGDTASSPNTIPPKISNRTPLKEQDTILLAGMGMVPIIQMDNL